MAPPSWRTVLNIVEALPVAAGEMVANPAAWVGTNTCEKRLLGASASYDGADVDAILGIEPVEKASFQKAAIKAPVAKEIAKSGIAGHIDDLTRRLNAFKARQNAAAIRQGSDLRKWVCVNC